MIPIWYKDPWGQWQVFPHDKLEQLPDGRWAWYYQGTGYYDFPIAEEWKKYNRLFYFDCRIERWIWDNR